MTGAYAAIGAAMLALAIVFLGRAGKAADPAQARGARMIGLIFILSGLAFIAAGAITMAKS